MQLPTQSNGHAVILSSCLLAVMLAACHRAPAPVDAASAAPTAASPAPRVAHAPFGTLPDGTKVELFTLTNHTGMQARITNYGGIVTSLKVPDSAGRFADVVLGYDSIDGYLKSSPYFGAIVGRYANRIGGARFDLEGRTFRLAANDGVNTLHGGIKGFDKAVWQATTFERADEVGILFTHTSADMEEGFPGALVLTVTYTLTDRNELVFDYRARTDKPTVLNLTHHDYFNLAGEGSGDVLAHEMMIAADRYTPVDAGLIPTGELASVAGTPLDFRTPTRIGERIDADQPQMKLGKGYDHNYVINRAAAGLVLAARVSEPTSGRVMEVHTTEPGMQFYTANHLDGSITGKDGRAYGRRGAFCLETQHFPDSPNHPSFPSTTLLPAQEFQSRTVYAFSAR